MHEEHARKARIAEIERVSHESTVSRKTQNGRTSQNQSKTGLSPLFQNQYIRRQRMQSKYFTKESSPRLGETRNLPQKLLGEIIGEIERKLITGHADKEQHQNEK